MINFKSFIAVSACAILAGCGSSTPDCSNSEVKSLVTNGIAEQMTKLATGLKTNELAKGISIVDISTTGRNEKLDTYNCKASFTFSFPKDSDKVLLKVFTDKEYKQKTQANLMSALGKFNGEMLLNQFDTAIGVGLMTTIAEIQLQGLNDKEYANKMIKEAQNSFKELTDGSVKSDIKYTIRAVKDSKEGNFSVNWEMPKNSVDVLRLFSIASVVYKHAAK